LEKGGMGGSISRRKDAQKHARDAALLAAPVPSHRHSVTTIKFCENGDLVVTASEDRTIVLWDFSQGQRFGKLWHLNSINDACSDVAEYVAASQGHPGTVAVCSLPDRRLESAPRRLPPHERPGLQWTQARLH